MTHRPQGRYTFRFMPETMKNMDMTGGVKLLICRYSFLSLVRLIYAAPNTIQDNNGEISAAAQIPEKSQKHCDSKDETVIPASGRNQQAAQKNNRRKIPGPDGEQVQHRRGIRISLTCKRS